jgi:hypothetical protein
MQGALVEAYSSSAHKPLHKQQAPAHNSLLRLATPPLATGLAAGEFVYLLNNGPETDTAIYDGNNNGLGLTESTAQIMRFDVKPLPVGQVARPFTPARQKTLNKTLIADYAATVKRIVPPATARQVGAFFGACYCMTVRWCARGLRFDSGVMRWGLTDEHPGNTCKCKDTHVHTHIHPCRPTIT